MTAINSYRGDAIPVAKVMQLAPVSVVSGQTFAIWCNGKPARYTATASDGIAGVCAGLVAACAANASTIPEFAEFVATVSANGLAVILTAATPGIPFDVAVTSSGNVVVTETTAGAGPTNEQHQISLLGTYTAGTFTLTYNFGSGNVTTGNIAWNATAATLQAALVALTGVGAGQVVVTGGPGPATPWYVTWTGTLAGTAVAVGTVNGGGLTGTGSLTITETQTGNGLSNCVQCLNLTGTSSATYTLTLGGQTTGSINYNATPATVQAALQALSNVGSGNCLVYGLGGGSGPNQNKDYYWIVFTGALAGVSVGTLTCSAGGVFGTNPVSLLQAGGMATADDFQVIDLGGATSGTFTLTFGGATTSPINVIPQNVGGWLNVRDDLQQAAGWTIAGNTVAVYDASTPGGQYNLNEQAAVAATNFLVHFANSQGNVQQPLISVNGAGLTGSSGQTVTRIAVGKASCDEIQKIVVNAGSGTFTLTEGAQTTAAIAYNASAATVQTRIATDLSTTITACTVTGAGTSASPYVVTVTTPANTPIALLTGNAGGLGGGGSIVEITHGTTGTNEVQTVTAASGVSGGTFTLGFGGATTSAIPWNATGAQVAAALDALSTVNTVGGSGSAGGPWTITWSGAQGSAQQPLLIGDGSLLTGATTSLVTQSTLTRSAGPNHADDPTNWTLGRCLNTLDSALFDLGSSDCLYGLNQIAIVTANDVTGTVCWALGAGGSAGNGAASGSFVAGQSVYFTNAGGALPTGVTAGTDYYLVNVNVDAGTAQLATTLGGAPITLSSNGTGTTTMGVRLNSLEETARFGGALGLARSNNLGYIEYRPRYLHFGLATSGQTGAQTVTIGTDAGSGAGKTQLDFDVDQAIIKILQTGGSIDTDARDVTIKGTNAANTLELLGGDVGIALFEGETAILATIKQRGGTLELGPGVTVNTSIEKTSGTLIADGATLNGTLTM